MVVSNSIKIGTIRRYLPQAIACIAKNLTMMNHCLASSLPSIIIPALTHLNPVNNPNENLSITSEEASWIASTYAVALVIGALMSGFLDPLGRKKSIILGNIPYLISWLCLYYSNTLWPIYISLILHGFTSGLIESPIICYLAELSEPSIRTILLASTIVINEFCSTLIFFLGNHMPWRDVSLICAIFPIGAVLIMFIIPETPHWLLSHDRPDDALKSLQWFRGWTEPENVQIEFENLKRYKSVAYVCYDCEKHGTECRHPQPKFPERFRDFLRRKTIIPLLILICLYSNNIFCGYVFRPFLVPILKYFKSPIDPNSVLVWVGYTGFVATILNLIIMKCFGKRILHLITLGLAILMIYVLGVYGFLEANLEDGTFLKYFPVIGILLWFFFFHLGVRPLPNLLISEIFSYRSKSLASGIALAVLNLGVFVTSKTFHLLQAAITLPGQFIFYATIAAVGFGIIYLVLPETEGRTLEDIEMYFSDKKRKFNDIHIPMIADQKEITNQSQRMHPNNVCFRPSPESS